MSLIHNTVKTINKEKKKCLVSFKDNEVENERKKQIQGHYGIQASYIYQCKNEKE
jgi:hypothetical protein